MVSNFHLMLYSRISAYSTQAFDAHGSIVSPISNAASPVDEAKREDAFSLVEKRACYDEEKIFVTAMPEAQVNRRPSNAPEAVFAAPAPEPVLPKYKETFPEVLPGRPDPIPFWKRHIKWLAAGMLGLAIILAIIVRVSVHAMNSKTTTTMTGSDVQAVLGRNNTLKSVASSGLFLKDGKTWNTQVYWQSSNGSINMQFSLDGKTFQPAKQVKLTFPPKVGSPISATAELDSVGTVVVCFLQVLSQHSDNFAAQSLLLDRHQQYHNIQYILRARNR